MQLVPGASLFVAMHASAVSVPDPSPVCVLTAVERSAWSGQGTPDDATLRAYEDGLSIKLVTNLDAALRRSGGRPVRFLNMSQRLFDQWQASGGPLPCRAEGSVMLRQTVTADANKHTYRVTYVILKDGRRVARTSISRPIVQGQIREGESGDALRGVTATVASETDVPFNLLWRVLK